LREKIKAPLNIIATPWAPPLKTLHKIGINRVSFGPYIFRSVMKKFEKIIEEMYDMGDYDCFTSEILTFDETAAYLISEKEK
jgi:2-methylisocitrate lyase-like PEP mutase family enzyme